MFAEIVIDERFAPDGCHFRIEYDEELALCGMDAYYVHRCRFHGDKLKNQRTVTDLPLPEPRVVLGSTRTKLVNGTVVKPTLQYYADLVIAESFEDALKWIGPPNMHYEDLQALRGKRRLIDAQNRYKFEADREPVLTGQSHLMF